MTPTRDATYGKDYKTWSISLTTEQHRTVKMLAAQYGVTAAEIARAALLDESLWRKAAKLKAKEKGE
jgi:hypothetical protein